MPPRGADRGDAGTGRPVFDARLVGQRQAMKGGSTVPTGKKVTNKGTEVKGKMKKKAGQATNDVGLEAEGRAEESKGSLKQAGQKAKDAFKK